MTSADFSQFVVTTANETACETSPLKVRTLSLHVPATFTGTSSNFWTSAFLAALSVFPSLICGFCPSGQRFAYSFLQIPPHDGHPCCSAMCFVVAYAHSGLSPVRARPWRANKKAADTFFSNASTASQLRFRILFSMADRLLFCFFRIPNSAVIFHIYTDLYRSVRFSFAQEAHSLCVIGAREEVYGAGPFQPVASGL